MSLLDSESELIRSLRKQCIGAWAKMQHYASQRALEQADQQRAMAIREQNYDMQEDTLNQRDLGDVG